MEAFSLKKVVKMLEDVVVGWQEVRWIWWLRKNFIAQFIQLWKRWLCSMWLDIVMKNWAHSVDQCKLQALQFSAHLIDLLSILLKCIGFSGVQKAVVDQPGCRPQTATMTFFFGASLAFRSASSWSIHWANHCQLFCKIHFSLHVTIQSRNGLLWLCRIRKDDASNWWLFDFQSGHEAPTYQAFSPFQFASNTEWL